MKTEFLSRFFKDLEKISSVKTKDKIEKIILEVKSSEKLSDIPNIKKLSGHRSAYRIIMGIIELEFLPREKLSNLAEYCTGKTSTVFFLSMQVEASQ